ncbi:OLC1v1009272C1 [Oldenlandia corymbosa var. corymbosa]|uniref:OLC1v1009272C1 n=1 Tax=Oldenlandia corymbosa var. corymbosa TaxID=529605 RepID=A0AAV1DQZ5_OLDCO|nr:OLC1v1009272C1 [Oldenlandia corymbosa var. corymbosa]
MSNSRFASLNEFSCNLETLLTGWNEYVAKKKSDGRLKKQTRRLFGRADDSDYDWVSAKIDPIVNKLHPDWAFFHMYVDCVTLWRHNHSDEAGAVRRRAEEKAKYILTNRDYFFRKPYSLLVYLTSLEREINDHRLLANIRKVLEESVQSRAYVVDFVHIFPPLYRFLEVTLPLINDLVVLQRELYFIYDELFLIRRYFDSVGPSLPCYVEKPHERYVKSAVLRIALQVCDIWFNRTDKETTEVIASLFVDLRQEIDPTNQEFLALFLKFQQGLRESGYYSKAADDPPLVNHFCSYLLCWHGVEDLKRELISLVICFNNSTLFVGGGEDVDAFSEEIKAVLMEAAFVHRRLQRESTFSDPADDKRNLTDCFPPCFELLSNICLLKTELFIKEQLHIPPPGMLFSDEQFFKVDMILTDLRAFAKDICGKSNREFVKQSLVLAEEFANEIESLQKSFQSKRIDHLLVKHSLLQLLFKIVFFKAESFLMESLKSTNISIAQNMHQIQSLLEELKYFKRIVRAKLTRNSPDEETAFEIVEVVCRRIALFSCSFQADNKKFEIMISSLPRLLDKVEVIKNKLGGISLPKFVFPKTDPQGFIDLLVNRIRELLEHDPELIAPSHDIKEILLHLESLEHFFREVKTSNFEMVELEDLGNHIIDIAYKLEFVVDSIQFDSHFQHSLWLYDLLVDVRFVDQQVSKLREISSSSKIKHSPAISSQVIPRDATPDINDLPIGLDDEEKAIVERLTRGTLQRDVISIVGMPGSGKTTLAAKVYNNQNIIFHFHRHAWCTVSQTYSKRELLLEVLSHLPVTENISKLSDDDLMSKLRRCLLGSRYLIVMDDIWDTPVWNDLLNCFPNESRGSRILITSRSREVALKINPVSNPHSIRPFSDDESWKLFGSKMFKGDFCPEELLEVGKEIAQCCQGLPLAVVAIAGLLQRTEQNKDSWKKILGTLSSEIINDPENRCKEILELSYKHLPEYLKACFLYLGVFLQDKDIHVGKLIHFWIAEGFIRATEAKNSEQVAEEYLMELINRSLVNIHRLRSNGKVKRCRLHDVLRDLCHLKAKEENFMQLVTSHDKPYVSFPDSDFGMEFVHSNEMAPIAFESYRLIFSLRRRHFIDSRPSAMGARCLAFFASIDSEPKCPYDISFICHNFRLLRVLDLEPIMAIIFPQEIGLMLHLRYLALSGYMQSIPPSIANLWKLETLVVNGLKGKIILPETIWSMRSLKYLHVNNHVGFSMNGLDEQVIRSLHWTSLISFSTPSFSREEDTVNILKRMPNLRNLRCMFFQSWDSCEENIDFPVLEFLTHLESLKVIYHGPALSFGEFVLPVNLKKLSLSNFHLQGSHLSMIGELPYLRVLKLVGGAFVEQTWTMNEKEFKELTYLELDSLHFVNWEASYDHLPRLERLVLRNCRDLELIPSDFAYISTLKSIEVQWCGQSVVASAEEIGDITEEIKVIIDRF